MPFVFMTGKSHTLDIVQSDLPRFWMIFQLEKVEGLSKVKLPNFCSPEHFPRKQKTVHEKNVTPLKNIGIFGCKKLTWQWNIHHLKMYFLLNMEDFPRCHVSELRGFSAIIPPMNHRAYNDKMSVFFI